MKTILKSKDYSILAKDLQNEESFDLVSFV
jgi:hypothetical protein